ncbi:MAG: pyridoxamine 5'-phosphate oxidase [Anaerolinea sp.]|nr:pyridoxamine 5'-phosphate oxidase [Anaerolinea sp.]
MATWSEFAAAMPEMAAAGRSLIYQFGPGLGYLATIRRDGAPRIHPFCPVIAEGHLWALIGPSPKRHDLRRDGRYAFHALSPQDRDDEFMLSGNAIANEDLAVRETVVAATRLLGVTVGDHDQLFELGIDRALLATYKPREQYEWPPTYTKWQAG